MKILVVEPRNRSIFDRLIQFTKTRFPKASVSVLARNDASQIPDGFERITVGADIFTRKILKERIVRQLRQKSFHCCILSFDHPNEIHFTLRMVPLLAHVSSVICVKEGKSLEYGRWGWIFSTICAEFLLRFLHWLFRWVDVVVVHFLAVLALGMQFSKKPLKEKEKYRVVHFINSLDLGGAQKQLLTLFQNLNRQKFELHLCLINQEHAFFEQSFRDLGFQFPYFRHESGRIFFYYTGLVFHAFRFFRQTKPDIVHCWLLFPDLFGSIAASFARIPVIYISIRSLHLHHYRWYSKWFRQMEWVSARLATRILANSRAVLEDYACQTPVSPDRLKLIYSGVECPEIKRYKKGDWNLEGIPTMAMIGRLSEEKDQATFLQACAMLKARIGSFRAFLLGDGELRRSLTEMAKRLGLQEEVVFLDRRSDVNQILGLIDLVVLTSREEGFPNVLLEAMAAGLPVVSTKAKGALEIVEDGITGYLVEIGEPASVAAACATILSDSDLARQMGIRGKQKAERDFNVEMMVRNVETLYEGKV